MHLRYLISGFAVLFLMPFAAYADGTDGNRYSDTLERRYHSEISASEAYLETQAHRDHSHKYRHERGGHAVIIDVRTIEEYVGGHPPGAYSIPYPHIHKRQCLNDPDCVDDYIGYQEGVGGKPPAKNDDDFVDAVDALDLPKDTLIITMCRTGFRSVNAGNLLADAGYTNVRNMWEGFKGRLKQNLAGDDVDLDGDGDIDGGAYSKDNDGWANFAALPVSMKLKHWRLYKPYMYLYYTVEGER